VGVLGWVGGWGEWESEQDAVNRRGGDIGRRMQGPSQVGVRTCVWGGGELSDVSVVSQNGCMTKVFFTPARNKSLLRPCPFVCN
jgi:hypothetical protein